MATLTEKHLTETERAFLESPFVATVTTLREDGSPHSTVVWVDVDDDGPSFNTAEGRAKVRHLREDPRVSLLVVDPEDSYRWLALDGRVELTRKDADAQIDKLAKKYLGEDEYPWRSPEEIRVTVRIHPVRVHTYGLD
jgi:PPOX class probable F420-dependent enzyme